ncbi:MAG: hypothetical protein AAGD35_14645 [Actinomycetota bacterium]
MAEDLRWRNIVGGAAVVVTLIGFGIALTQLTGEDEQVSAGDADTETASEVPPEAATTERTTTTIEQTTTTAPEPVVVGPVEAPGPVVSGELLQRDSTVIVRVDGPPDVVFAHGFVDVDGDPSTGMARRGGADLLFEEDYLYVWDLDHCNDDEQYWCWNPDAVEVDNYGTEDVGDGVTRHSWQVARTAVGECGQGVRLVAGVDLTASEAESSSQSEPLPLGCPTG